MARATAELHVGLSELDVEVGDLESARRHLEAAAALADRAAMTESRYRWFVAMGLLARADGDPEAAIDLLDQAEQLYRPGFFPDVRPIAAIKARVWIAQGNLAEAADWARDRGVSATDDASYLREFDHLTLVRLLLAQHRAHPDTGALDRAAGLLDRLRDAAETSGRAGSLLEIRLLQALVHDAQGHRPRALAVPGRSLGRWRPSPRATSGSSWTRALPMLELLRDAEHAGRRRRPRASPARASRAPGRRRGRRRRASPASAVWPTR